MQHHVTNQKKQKVAATKEEADTAKGKKDLDAGKREKVTYVWNLSQRMLILYLKTSHVF